MYVYQTWNYNMQIYIKYLDITKKYIQQKTKTDYIELKQKNPNAKVPESILDFFISLCN